MSVWLAVPSARPPAEANPVLERWRQMGYKIALWRDLCTLPAGPDREDFIAQEMAMPVDSIQGDVVYPGYAMAVNALIADLLIRKPEAEWFVAAGDDTLPDPNHTADEIAAQCSKHFAELHAGPDASAGVDISVKSISAALRGLEMHTFGVMQCTGDRFGQSPHFHPPKDRGDGIACGCGYLLSHPVHTGGAYIDFVAGSAWYGRSYCQRMYGGRGPLWPEYTHMFVDTEAREVAVKMGVYWERRDLVQVHNHWSRELGAKAPAFLAEASGQAHWDKYRAIYEGRRAAGFPGSEPL